MITELTIQNIALIDRLRIAFFPGFNVLTGETGAGKSIMIDAVNLVLGERANRELVKAGTDFAKVEAAFLLTPDSRAYSTLVELGFELEPDEPLFLSRELTAAGKSVCRINGKMVPLTMLKQVSDQLVDIHGQHEHQSLLNVAEHIRLLDQFAGETVSRAHEKASEIYREYVEAKRKLETQFGNDADRERMLDMLAYQIREIEQAQLSDPNEEETLRKERGRLINAAKISDAIQTAYQAIYAGQNVADPAMDLVRKATDAIQGIAEYDEAYQASYDKLNDAYYQLEDVALELRDFKNSFDYHPARLEEIEQRLDVIRKLKRKYGGSIEEIIAFWEQALQKQAELLDSASAIQRLQEKIAKLRHELYDQCVLLSRKRRTAAKVFERKMLEQLQDLGMGKTRFSVAFNEIVDESDIAENAFTSNGLDQVEFLIAPNPGQPLKPLTKIVSGGEMSRIMLALKNIAANLDEIPTVIFDEIDTGISGRMAEVVGHKMLQIAQSRQVICVTHLAQIACMADAHYRIEKTNDENTTKTIVSLLDEYERPNEIARITGGANLTKLGIEHAQELIVSANHYKQNLKNKI